MKKQKSMGNKGFSLVELIIVIAIMAILVGVMAPQLLKYVERTRVSADTQVADTVRTAIVTSLMDPQVDDAPSTKAYATLAALYGDATSPKFVAAVKDVLNETDATKVDAKLKSKAYKGQPIKIDIADNKVKITIDTKDSTQAPNLVIE